MANKKSKRKLHPYFRIAREVEISPADFLNGWWKAFPQRKHLDMYLLMTPKQYDAMIARLAIAKAVGTLEDFEYINVRVEFQGRIKELMAVISHLTKRDELDLHMYRDIYYDTLKFIGSPNFKFVGMYP